MKLLPLQRAWSATVALLCLAESVCVGLLIPRARTIYAGFGAELTSNWMVMSLPWSWCIPLGVLLAIALIAKDFWCHPHAASRINLIFLWVGLLTWVACMSIVIRPPFFTFPQVITK